MEFQLKKLAKVLISDFANLPDSPGIYFVCDAGYRCWYVGKSDSSLRKRHSNHEKLNSFKDKGCQWICYQAWMDLEDISEWEIGSIQKFKPPLNDLFNPEELPLIDLGYDKSQFFSRYKEIKLIQKALEQELEELAPNLISLLEENGGKFQNHDLKAYLQSRKNWQYSSQIEIKQSEIKELKKLEEKNGIASIKSITVFPVVR